MNVIWSDEAKQRFENIIDDLIDNWPIEIVLRFEFLVFNLIDLLKTNRKLCPKSKHNNLRRCVIHKNVSLIYRLHKSNIEVVTLVYNKNNHGFFDAI